MKRNEIILGIAFLLLLAGLVGWPFVNKKFFQPIEERKERIGLLEQKASQQRKENNEILRAAKKFKDWEHQSLPPNSLNAQRLYQEWLNDLAEMCDFTGIQMMPERRARKDDVYVAVQVGLEGEATLSELAMFLHRFHRTDLLHRIIRMDLESTGSEGDPVLEVSLTAEALSLPNVAPRSRLFPEAMLATELSTADNQLELAEIDSFFTDNPPPTPFRIRVGSEFMTVTEIDGKRWRVVRGVEETKIASHDADSIVEFAPIRADREEIGFEAYQELIASSPFAKPLPPVEYRPRLDFADVTFIRGEDYDYEVTLRGVDLAAGDVNFELTGEIPEGLRIADSDRDRTVLHWEPPDDLEAGDYPVSLSVHQQGNPEPLLTQTATLSLREPNNPPQLSELENQTVYVGQSLMVFADANDIDGDPLAFSLGQGAPQGALIEEASGVLLWEPDPGTQPGEYQVPIVVTDAGFPPKSDQKTLVVTVADDVAQFTYLVGSLTKGGKKTAWLYDRSNDQRFVLQEGQMVNVAHINAKVLLIGRDFVLLQTGKDTWRLELGQNLRAMSKLENATEPTPPRD